MSRLVNAVVRGAARTLTGAALAALAITALAQARHAGPARPAWHGDIQRFHEHDWDVWRGGRWVHGPHSGHMGWWWVVGSVWYFYPSPVYPYPNPYEPPPPWVVSPQAVPPAQFWYFCESAQGYYPYVQTCPGGWKQVPATPPDVPVPPTK